MPQPFLRQHSSVHLVARSSASRSPERRLPPMGLEEEQQSKPPSS
jgi:hypothetical protein